jgi:hypothetical protein
LCYLLKSCTTAEKKILGQLLLEQHFVPLGSNLWLGSEALSNTFIQQLTIKYSSKVLIMNIDEFQVGDINQVITSSEQGLADHSFSSVGNQLTQLLNDFKVKKRLNEQDKTRLFLAFQQIEDFAHSCFIPAALPSRERQAFGALITDWENVLQLLPESSR